MSYEFAGNDNDNIRGTLTTALNIGDNAITIAAYVKYATGASDKSIVAFSDDTANINNGLTLYQATASSIAARATSTAAATTQAAASLTIEGQGWKPVVAIFRSTMDRQAYAGNSSTTNGVGSTSNDAGTGMDTVTIGTGPTNSGDFTGFIAEVAIWKKALTTEEIDSYCGGTSASLVAASDLVGYWPLSADNATQSNLGTDASGDLTVSGAAYSSDHPTISFGLTKYLKLLSESAAASATGVEVVVHSAPSGSNYVTGTTRYGSASGQAFEASLESGQAVLKVLASDVGCSSLAADTVVSACARNTTYTTGMVSATIIEE